jgi:recombination protein RecT
MSNKLAPADEVKMSLARMKDQFRAALPAHIQVDKFIRVLQTAVATTPQLVQAPRPALYSACMKAAQDGLIPDGREAALVTFNTKSGVHVAYMPMVAGILKKVRNSGELSSITSQLIYEKDEFEFYVDEDGEHLKHKPNMFAESRGAMLGAYALAKTKDGAVYIEVMTVDQIKAVKDISKGKTGPWSGPFESEMIKKTTIKRLAKRLPMSTDLDHTLHADDELFDLNKDTEPMPTEQPTKPSRRLVEMMDHADEQVVDVTPEEPPTEPTQPEPKNLPI